MAKYLISFPSRAMNLDPSEFAAAGRDSRAVIVAAQAAGVYVFAGGIDEGVAPLLVTADGAASEGTHPDSHLTGGFTILELPSQDEAIVWARRIAAACRCAQELRVFMFDPLS